MQRVMWYKGTAQLLSLTEPEYPEKTIDDELQKMQRTKARKFSSHLRLEPTLWHWLLFSITVQRGQNCGMFQVFAKTSMKELVAKSRLLTGYLELLIHRAYSKPKRDAVDGDADHVFVEILTPSDPRQRGAQLSLAFSINLHQVIQELAKRGVVVSTSTSVLLM